MQSRYDLNALVDRAINTHGPLAFDFDQDGQFGDRDRMVLLRLFECELDPLRPLPAGQAPLPIQPRIVMGRWKLVGVLGVGGQATTYLAEDSQTGTWVALKELNVGDASDWKAIELFEREAQALRQINHPRVPKYVASFDDRSDGNVRLYIAQEFVNGHDLAHEVKSFGALTEQAACSVRDAVFDVLEYLHGQNPPVLHRDIKPSNLVRRPDGQIAVVDFGGAQIRHTKPEGGSTVVGTSGYMPIEQYMGRATPASDLYALGATLAHLVSGADPSTMSVIENRLQVPQLRMSSPFLNGLNALLEPAAEKRSQNVAAARAAFQTAMAAPAATDVAPTGYAATATPHKSNVRISPLFIAIPLMIMAYIGASVYRGQQGHPDNHVKIENIYPERPKDSINVLFVGNSHIYFRNQPRLWARMIPEGQPKLWFEVWAAPGLMVQEHVDMGVAEKLREKDWDVVLLQPQSLEPTKLERYFGEGVGNFEAALPDELRSVVWVPWARDPKYDIYGLFGSRGKTDPKGAFRDLTKDLEKGVRTWVGSSDICPLGAAYLESRESNDVKLISSMDGNKPTSAGTYLNGLMIYACLYQRSPSEITYVPKNVDEEDAGKLKTAAQAVADKYGFIKNK